MVRVDIDGEIVALDWEEFEARCRAGRIPPEAKIAIDAITDGAFVVAGDLELYRDLRNEEQIAWQRRLLSGPPPLLTALLVGFNIRVWWVNQSSRVSNTVVETFANWPAAVFENGEGWRLWTMGVLHVEAFHLFMNMLWLAYTGWNLERALGWRNLAAIYAASVVGGSVLSAVMSPWDLSLGASGGVFGTIAASVAFGFSRPELLPERGRVLFGAALLPYLGLMFFSGLGNDGIDNWSHFGGLLTGIVLGFNLDPESLERKRGYNARIRTLSMVACALVTLAPILVGPRIHPTMDAREALLRKSKSRSADTGYRSLHYNVPAGWRQSSLLGLTGWRSPIETRAWMVSEQQSGVPLTSEQLAHRYIERHESLQVIQQGPVDLAGHPGFELIATAIIDEAPRRIRWRGASHGVWSLQVLQVEDTSRLAPLFARLDASVSWTEPEELWRARRDVDQLPQSRLARTALAKALTRYGLPEEALPVWNALLEQAPEDVDAHAGKLSFVRWYPELEPDIDATLQAALDLDDTKLIGEVVETLEVLGREDDAVGVLEQAWLTHPRSRNIRRLRQARRLDVTQDEDKQPTVVSHEPLSREPRPTPLTVPTGPPELAQARQYATRAKELQDAVASSMVEASEDDALVEALLWLKRGPVPQGPLEAEREGLREDFRFEDPEQAPRWIPKAVLARAELVDRARAVLEPEVDSNP